MYGRRHRKMPLEGTFGVFWGTRPGEGDRPMRIVVLIQVAATLMMTGVTWFAQVAHYPLLGLVGSETFAAYQTANMDQTTLVVGPLIAAEGVTALMLLWRRPGGIRLWQALVGVALLGVIWLSTAFFQVPMHEVLTGGFDPAAHRHLVVSNWIRTVAWSTRGVLVLWMAGRMGD
jgi:hypothetical protein